METIPKETKDTKFVKYTFQQSYQIQHDHWSDNWTHPGEELYLPSVVANSYDVALISRHGKSQLCEI